jgi:hypothetical protein
MKLMHHILSTSDMSVSSCSTVAIDCRERMLCGSSHRYALTLTHQIANINTASISMY